MGNYHRYYRKYSIYHSIGHIFVLLTLLLDGLGKSEVRAFTLAFTPFVIAQAKEPLQPQIQVSVQSAIDSKISWLWSHQQEPFLLFLLGLLLLCMAGGLERNRLCWLGDQLLIRTATVLPKGFSKWIAQVIANLRGEHGKY